jgi:hypothetical protein
MLQYEVNHIKQPVLIFADDFAELLVNIETHLFHAAHFIYVIISLNYTIFSKYICKLLALNHETRSNFMVCKCVLK